MKKNHNCKITLNEAIDDQTELRKLINNLNNDYNRRSSKKRKRQKKVLKSAEKLLDTRYDIIGFFEKGTFPYKGNVFKTKEEEEEESEENKLKKIKDDYKKFFKYIEDESKSINYDLYEKYFYSSVPTVLVKKTI